MIVTEIQNFLNQLMLSIDWDVLFFIGVGFEILFALFFIVKSHYAYEMRLVRKLSVLNTWLSRNQYIDSNNLLAFNELMKSTPKQLRHYWHQYMLYREKEPSFYMSDYNCIEKPLKTSSFASNIKNFSAISYSFAFFMFVFGIAALASDPFQFSLFAKALITPVIIIILNTIFVMILRARENMNLATLYQYFHYFNRFLDKAVTTMPEYVDFEVLFTRQEIRKGIPVLNEYLEKRARQEQEELEKARLYAVEHEQYDFNDAGIDGALVLDRAMKETETYLNIRQRLLSEIEQFESEIDSLKRNYENTQKEYQKKLQASKENVERLRQQQEESTNRIETNYIKKQQSDEIKKQEQLEKDHDTATIRFNQEMESLTQEIETRRADLAERKQYVEDAMRAEYQTFSSKMYKSVVAVVEERVNEEKQTLVDMKDEIAKELEEANLVISEKNKEIAGLRNLAKKHKIDTSSVDGFYSETLEKEAKKLRRGRHNLSVDDDFEENITEQSLQQNVDENSQIDENNQSQVESKDEILENPSGSNDANLDENIVDIDNSVVQENSLENLNEENVSQNEENNLNNNENVAEVVDSDKLNKSLDADNQLKTENSSVQNNSQDSQEFEKVYDENGCYYDEKGNYIYPNGAYYDPEGCYHDELGGWFEADGKTYHAPDENSQQVTKNNNESGEDETGQVFTPVYDENGCYYDEKGNYIYPNGAYYDPEGCYHDELGGWFEADGKTYHAPDEKKTKIEYDNLDDKTKFALAENFGIKSDPNKEEKDKIKEQKEHKKLAREEQKKLRKEEKIARKIAKLEEKNKLKQESPNSLELQDANVQNSELTSMTEEKESAENQELQESKFDNNLNQNTNSLNENQETKLNDIDEKLKIDNLDKDVDDLQNLNNNEINFDDFNFDFDDLDLPNEENLKTNEEEHITTDEDLKQLEQQVEELTQQPNVENKENLNSENKVVPVAKKRGRPKKVQTPENNQDNKENDLSSAEQVEPVVKKRPGRPRKDESLGAEKPKKLVGRPKKVLTEEEKENLNKPKRPGRPRKDKSLDAEKTKKPVGRPKKVLTEEEKENLNKPKRPVGRPRKNSSTSSNNSTSKSPKKVGRPRKNSEQTTEPTVKRGRGRPKKVDIDEIQKLNEQIENENKRLKQRQKELKSQLDETLSILQDELD